MQLSVLVVHVYLGNTQLRSPPCKAVPGTVTGQAARREAALTLAFREGRGSERKQAPWLSGRSNKALSAAVRMTQGDVPDRISSTLFSVPKPKG